ncbi:MAG TPA: tetratricopeptide repeat protein [Polyangia bacterium]|nr:tetratricopeptide repeat protein [Polyangia bacterium]
MRARPGRSLSILVMAVVWMACAALAGGVANAGDYAKAYAEGLRHSRRAATLAGANNCKAAVPEYTKAIKLLKDPVLLFNRAECYRTLGNRAAALTDYRRFLAELPNAPNRAEVEANIAALEPPPARPAAPAAPVPAPPAVATVVAPRDSTAMPMPMPGEPVERAPLGEPAPGPGSTLVVPPSPRREIITQLDDSRMEPTPVAPGVDVVHVNPPPAPLAPADVEGTGSKTSRWWLWTLAAVVLAGGGVTTYLLLRGGKTDAPSSDLGNYRF